MDIDRLVDDSELCSARLRVVREVDGLAHAFLEGIYGHDLLRRACDSPCVVRGHEERRVTRLTI